MFKGLVFIAQLLSIHFLGIFDVEWLWVLQAVSTDPEVWCCNSSAESPAVRQTVMEWQESLNTLLQQPEHL